MNSNIDKLSKLSRIIFVSKIKTRAKNILDMKKSLDSIDSIEMSIVQNGGEKNELQVSGV